MQPRVLKGKSLARSRTITHKKWKEGKMAQLYSAYYDEMMAPPAPAPDELSFLISCGDQIWRLDGV